MKRTSFFAILLLFAQISLNASESKSIRELDDAKKHKKSKICKVTTNEYPCSVRFSPDGKQATVRHLKFGSTLQTTSIDGTKDRTYCVDEMTGTFKCAPRSRKTKWSKPVPFSADAIVTAIAESKKESERDQAYREILSLIPEGEIDTWQYTESVAVSPNKKFVVIAHAQRRAISLYKIDNEANTASCVASLPMQRWELPNAVAFHPQGKLFAVADCYSGNVHVFSFDEETAQIGKAISCPPMETGESPYSIAFSPNGQLAAVVSYYCQNLRIYEVDEQTGAFSPITGDVLKAQRQKIYKKVQEAFELFGRQQHPTVRGATSGIGPFTRNPLYDLLKEYIV